jgi:hypothetical protein
MTCHSTTVDTGRSRTTIKDAKLTDTVHVPYRRSSVVDVCVPPVLHRPGYGFGHGPFGHGTFGGNP